MTDKFYVGTKADCEVLCAALDLIYDCPRPPESGPYSCTTQQRAEKTAQWFALSKEQRDSQQFDPLWIGWSLRYADIVREVSPGTRFAVWIPATLQTAMNTAVSNGIVFSLEQTLVMLAASASALAVEPGDWISL